ncbi:membrane protein [Bacillus thuringiensis MC28]|nr:membrane protein [Bacillus thuringiensis MC28]
MLALIPVLCLVVGPVFANSVTPYVLGMPFLLFWVLLSVLITSLCMGVVYVFDPANKGDME